MSMQNTTDGVTIAKMPQTTLEHETNSAIYKAVVVLKDRLESYGKRSAAELTSQDIQEILVITQNLRLVLMKN